ncbi:MAG: hypothetical protein FWD31_13235, partial [Planctomycetaceae bacterium]|nr:hypothetical protein [Planctomycetaceae bacterium]
NTVQMAHMIACQALFDTDIDVAPENTIVAPMSAEKEREIFLRERGPYGFGFRGLGLDQRWALAKRVAVDVSREITEMPQPEPIPRNQRTYTFGDFPYLGSFQYNMESPGRGFASLGYGDVGLFTGFVEEGKEYRFGDLTIKFDKTNLDWVTVSLTVIEEQKRLLLVATGETRNTDMQLESLGDDRVTVGNRWGKAPVLCEGIPATILFPGDPPPNMKIRYWPLDESGKRREELKPEVVDGQTAIVLKPEYKTIWYEIEIQ